MHLSKAPKLLGPNSGMIIYIVCRKQRKSLNMKLSCKIKIYYPEDLLMLNSIIKYDGPCFGKWLFETKKFAGPSSNGHLESGKKKNRDMGS